MTQHAEEHTTLTRLASAVNDADGSGTAPPAPDPAQYPAAVHDARGQHDWITRPGAGAV